MLIGYSEQHKKEMHGYSYISRALLALLQEYTHLPGTGSGQSDTAS